MIKMSKTRSGTIRRLLLDTLGAAAMQQENHESLLLEASEAGDLEKVCHIVREAAPPVDLNCRDETGDTPLILAASSGNHELVQFLLNEGAAVDAANNSGDNALIAASERSGNTAILKLLLDRGAEINGKNELGRTALIEAASMGRLQNAVLLLQHNADLNVVTSEEETALTFAVVHEYPDIVKALIEAGADVNWKSKKGWWTPLTYAVYSRNVEIVRLLIDAGADPNIEDANGDTILIHAVRSGAVAVVREVLKKASNVNHRGNDGMTALDHAARNGMEEIGRLLREELPQN